MKPLKFRNTIIKWKGLTFRSKREWERYLWLNNLRKKGCIRELKLQRRFSLRVNGILICSYDADFIYFQGDEDYPELIVEDVKPKKDKDKDGKLPKYYRDSPAGKLYDAKKKLMKAIYNIDIQEV